jgi:hypothetical protein
MKRLISEMGFSEVSITTSPALKNRPSQSIIMDRSNLGKPFSLDELLKKFSLKKISDISLIGPIGPMPASDFVIVIGSDLADKLVFDEETSANAIDDAGFSEVLQPQEKK